MGIKIEICHVAKILMVLSQCHSSFQFFCHLFEVLITSPIYSLKGLCKGFDKQLQGVKPSLVLGEPYALGYPSSHNHSSVENGCISTTVVFFTTTTIFH